MTPSVTRNDAASRFESDSGHGVAVLTYTRTGDTLDLVHTEVPDAAQGAGFGQALVTAALDYARSETLRVIPTCPFVRHFIDDHPEYAGLVAAP